MWLCSFDTNSDQIKSQQIPELDQFVSGLQKRGFKKLEIIGHTDSIGPAEFNLDLSQNGPSP